MGQCSCCAEVRNDEESMESSEPVLLAPELAALARALRLESSEGASLEYISHSRLPAQRREVFADAFPEVASACEVISILASKRVASQEGLREFVAVLPTRGAALALVMGSCQIMFEDLTPSECIEYAFSEDPGRFRLAQVSQDALEAYRGMKFDAWKHILKEPTCEAAFRRMLQIGPVTRLYDPNVFPTPSNLKSLYQVTDEKTGKLMELPHPVAALRIWDAKDKRYEAIDPQLAGAPSAAHAASWWAEQLRELKELRGEEYINSMLKA